jgi:hypothetical protein
MHRFEIKRSLRILAACSALLLAAACGGGDKSPTGPGPGGNDGGDNGGGNNGGGGGNGFAGDYQLLSVGKIALPANLTFDQCDPARVFGGALRMNADGTWEFAISLADAYGTNDEFDDEGTWQWDGTRLQFQSEAYGDSFSAKIDGAIMMDYDYCPDGQSDIQLVFGQ